MSLAGCQINPKICDIANTANTDKRTDMSGPEISWYGESILGCGLWPGLGWTVGKKGLGRL